MKKKAWTMPVAVVEQFDVTEYISACSYEFTCFAGADSSDSSSYSYTSDTNGDGKIHVCQDYSCVEDDEMDHIYGVCRGEPHTATVEIGDSRDMWFEERQFRAGRVYKYDADLFFPGLAVFDYSTSKIHVTNQALSRAELKPTGHS